VVGGWPPSSTAAGCDTGGPQNAPAPTAASMARLKAQFSARRRGLLPVGFTSCRELRKRQHPVRCNPHPSVEFSESVACLAPQKDGFFWSAYGSRGTKKQKNRRPPSPDLRCRHRPQRIGRRSGIAVYELVTASRSDHPIRLPTPRVGSFRRDVAGRPTETFQRGTSLS